MDGAWERRVEGERRRKALKTAAERLVMASELRDWERFTPAPAPVVFEDAGFQLPTGTPFIRPIEDQPTVEEFAAQMRPAGQLVSDVAFGPEVESVLPGEQEAGLLERFIRTQAGEQEFRTSAERFGEGRTGAGIGWGLLGLAAAIPLFGDVAQAGSAVSRATRATRAIPEEFLSAIPEGRRAFAEAAFERGYAELPSVVKKSEFRDSEYADISRYIPIYRGIRGGAATRGSDIGTVVDAEDAAFEFINGRLYLGGGTAGPGTYFTMDPAFARDFAIGTEGTWSFEPGVVIRGFLPVDAKILDLTDEWPDWIRAGSDPHTEAVKRGYDAIKYDTNYVVLNRSALTVMDEPIPVSIGFGARLRDRNRFLNARRGAADVARGAKVVNPDIELAGEGVVRARLRSEISPDDVSYRISHTAPTSDGGGPMHDLTQIYPDDIYGPDARRLYGDYQYLDDVDVESEAWVAVDGARGNPEALVNIYRAVPETAPDEILLGDWVTPSRSYAEIEAGRIVSVPHKILTAQVPAKHLYTNGDSIMEWGYDPRSTGDVARGAIRGVQASPEVSELLTSSARVRELSESQSIADAVELGALGDIPYDPVTGIGGMQSRYAQLVNSADGSRLIDELVASYEFPTPLDLPESEARAVLAIAQEEMGNAPSVLMQGVRGSESAEVWRKVAEGILDRAESASEWGGSKFNYFWDNPDITDKIALAAFKRAESYASSVADIMAYRAYLRILDEIGPLAAQSFSGAMASNYRAIPEIINFLDEAAIVINVPDQALRDVLRTRRFYNQYLSGYSSGYYAPHIRVEQEFIGQGIPISAGPFSRPVYGYLALPELDQVARSRSINRIFSEEAGMRPFADEVLKIFTDYTEGYGDYAFVLKPEMRNSSTFTFDDSLSAINMSSPISGASPSDVITAGLRNAPDPKNDYGEMMYMEAQVFPGDADITDMVDYIVSKYPPSDEVLRNIRRVFGDIEIKVMYP